LFGLCLGLGLGFGFWLSLGLRLGSWFSLSEGFSSNILELLYSVLVVNNNTNNLILSLKDRKLYLSNRNIRSFWDEDLGKIAVILEDEVDGGLVSFNISQDITSVNFFSNLLSPGNDFSLQNYANLL